VRHDIHLRGHAYEIRPVEMGDAAYMLGLRTDPELSRLIHPTSPRLEDQQEYLHRYFERPGDYYFIVVRTSSGRCEGTIAVYDVDPTRGQAEWGRWVMAHDSMAAPESALLIYRVAFNALGLNRTYSRTALANHHVVAFHEYCGLQTNTAVSLKHDFGGIEYEAVEHFLTRDRWPRTESLLDERARTVARLLQQPGRRRLS
jgi:RimJ/RimL family protein N-acetyltransferase